MHQYWVDPYQTVLQVLQHCLMMFQQMHYKVYYIFAAVHDPSSTDDSSTDEAVLTAQGRKRAKSSKGKNKERKVSMFKPTGTYLMFYAHL